MPDRRPGLLPEVTATGPQVDRRRFFIGAAALTASGALPLGGQADAALDPAPAKLTFREGGRGFSRFHPSSSRTSAC